MMKKAFSVVRMIAAAVLMIMALSAPIYAASKPANQKALTAVAEAYWKRGRAIQYDGFYPKQTGFYPLEATLQNRKYMVCSSFIGCVYDKALNLELPGDVSGAIDSVIGSEYEVSGLTFKSKEDIQKYLKDKAKQAKTKKTTREKLIAAEIAQKVQPGDVLIYRIASSGHEALVTQILRDSKGRPYDFVIIDSRGKTEEYEDSVSDYNPKFREGTVRKSTMSKTCTKLDIAVKFAVLRCWDKQKVKFQGKKTQYPAVTKYAEMVVQFPKISAELSASTGDHTPMRRGTTNVYTVKVINQDSKVHKVPVEVVVPAGMKVIRSSITGGGTVIKDGSGYRVRWSVSLPANSTRTRTVKLQAANTVSKKSLTVTGYLLTYEKLSDITNPVY